MKKICLALLVACAAGSLYAQAPRTFVSGTGVDTGTCPSTAPCRSFSFAFSQTSSGGDIVALDTAGYGVLTITHAVNIIVPPGILGAITVPTAGTGITINAPSTDVVRVRGVHINAGGSNTIGVLVTTTAPKRVELNDLEIDGLAIGIDVAVDSRLYANNLTISDFSTGVWIHGAGVVPTSIMKVFVQNSNLVGGTTGFEVDEGALGTSYVYGYYIQSGWLIGDNTHVSGCTPQNPYSYRNFTGFGTDSRNNANDFTACQSP